MTELRAGDMAGQNPQLDTTTGDLPPLSLQERALAQLVYKARLHHEFNEIAYNLAHEIDSDLVTINIASDSTIVVIANSLNINIMGQYNLNYRAAGYLRTDSFILNDIDGRHFLRDISSRIIDRPVVAMAREPVAFEGTDLCISILALRCERQPDERQPWGESTSVALKRSSDLIGRRAKMHVAAACAVTAEIAQRGAIDQSFVNSLPYPAIVLDADLHPVVVNDLFDFARPEESTGQAGLEQCGTAEAELPPFEHALWSLVRTPDDGKVFLCVGLETLAAPCKQPVASGAPAAALAPVDAFLTSTLPEQAVLHKRGGLTYLSLRKWRQSIKEHQIAALRAVKRQPFGALERVIAREMQETISHMIGFDAFSAIVPIPGGHSRMESSLSVRIAERLGELVGLPVVHAFAFHPLKGSSHPRQKRPPLHLVDPPRRPVILVDDVATSGRHLEEAAALLRPAAGAVFAAAWIGGVHA